ncbi:hypothetical protein [Chitinophaga skermanii]|nr:hypothetical protein [Chitinophaga skermanii]
MKQLFTLGLGAIILATASCHFPSTSKEASQPISDLAINNLKGKVESYTSKGYLQPQFKNNQWEVADSLLEYEQKLFFNRDGYTTQLQERNCLPQLYTCYASRTTNFFKEKVKDSFSIENSYYAITYRGKYTWLGDSSFTSVTKDSLGNETVRVSYRRFPAYDSMHAVVSNQPGDQVQQTTLVQRNTQGEVVYKIVTMPELKFRDTIFYEVLQRDAKGNMTRYLTRGKQDGVKLHLATYQYYQ